MKLILFSGACLLLAVACRPEPAGLPVGASVCYPIQFHVDFTEDVRPFPETRSMPDNTIPEPELPASSTGAIPYNRLEYVVFRTGSDTPFKQKRYTENDDDFGIVYDSLPEGDYRIGFLAHSSPNPVLSENRIFSFDSISDTFFLLQELAVARGEEIRTDILLKRVVSRIEFIAKDPVPAHLHQFDLNVGNYPNRFDLLAGTGLAAPDSVRLSRLFAPEEAGAPATCHAFYCFGPETGKPVGVMLNALDNNQEVYYARTVVVQPQIDKIVRYRGYLYTVPVSDDAFSCEVDTSWSGTIENELPD